MPQLKINSLIKILKHFYFIKYFIIYQINKYIYIYQFKHSQINKY